MKIGVCIKPVPNSDALLAIAGSGNGSTVVSIRS